MFFADGKGINDDDRRRRNVAGRKPERRVRNAVREEGVSDRIADDLRIIQIVILTKIASAKPRIYNRLQAFAARFNDTKQNNFGARRDNFSAVLIYNGGVDTVQLHFSIMRAMEAEMPCILISMLSATFAVLFIRLVLRIVSLLARTLK